MAVRHFKVLIQWDPVDRVWVTHVPVLNNMSTFGETRDEAIRNTEEAITGYLEAAENEGITITATDPDVELVDVAVSVA